MEGNKIRAGAIQNTVYVLLDARQPHSALFRCGQIVGEAGENFNAIIRKVKQLRRLLDCIEKRFLNTRHTFVPLVLFDFFTDAIKRESETED